jgi:squalene synthase HpnC
MICCLGERGQSHFRGELGLLQDTITLRAAKIGTVPRERYASKSKKMIQEELALYGPKAQQPRVLTPRQSRKYCRRLAARHYENFTVASLFLPRRLRQHFCNIYAYCRWADDLADESLGPGESLALLAWWERLLRDCFAGRAKHPVFTALRETIGQFEIPVDPFVDLLVAFRQDQHATRYETFDELENYCRYSANPVGRLVLYLGRCHSVESERLSDSICTGLQLANFCQDVARDWDRGRIYLPLDDCRRFGYDESMFAARQFNPAFHRLLSAQVEIAEGWLLRGKPLLRMLPRELRLPVALFIEGGLVVLEAIRQQNYDVWTSRPTVSKMDKSRIAAACWWRQQRGKLAE